jgi:hypothetical protein
MRMPGSVTDFNGEESFSQELARVPVTGRPGMPGVYVAYAGGYPSTDRVMVWKVGEAASINLALDDSGDFDDVAIASDPEGRIWVLWSRQVNYKPRIFARRSDPEVTKFGAPVSIAAPAGADSIWHMVADAQTSVVDVVASFSTPGSLAQWHIQMAPGLSTDQSTKVIKEKGKVAFGIADAGDPIEGAKISVGGKSALTDEAGEASIKLGPYPKTKTLKGTITKEGYAQRSFSVKVKT